MEPFVFQQWITNVDFGTWSWPVFTTLGHMGMSLDPEHKRKPEGLQGSAGGQLIHHLPAGSPCWHLVAGVAAAAPPPECKNHTAAASLLPSAAGTKSPRGSANWKCRENGNLGSKFSEAKWTY